MSLNINGVEIEDTFAEAFTMWGSRVIITAKDKRWAMEAALKMTGFATSIIACQCEAGIEGGELENSPDGRPGVSVLYFVRTKEDMGARLVERIGQCVMTCATTSCFNGLESADRVSVGGQLRYFGEGYQMSKVINNRRFWRIPVMEGEFLVEDQFGLQLGITSNFIILGENSDVALEAAERAVDAIRQIPGVTMPFPGGVVRSGSKAGSKYKFLNASTNEIFCPTLRGVVKTTLPEGVNSVMEIVVIGLNLEQVKWASRAGIQAACIPGIRRISASNFGGRLGKYKVELQKLMEGTGTE